MWRRKRVFNAFLFVALNKRHCPDIQHYCLCTEEKRANFNYRTFIEHCSSQK